MAYDYIYLTAAHKNELNSAVVLWGHGSFDEIEQHKPTYILSDPQALLQFSK